MITNNKLSEKSKLLAIEILKIRDYLHKKGIYEIANQLVRSGTSVGANLREATYAANKKDFYNKCNIALKEAAETEFWLEILFESKYISEENYSKAYMFCKDCLYMLIATLKKRDEEIIK